MLRQFNTTLAFDTRGRGLVEITRPVADWTAATDMENGLLTLFVRHTSASLVVQENVDPDVRGDLERFQPPLVPDGHSRFRHRDEGPDHMPAQVRAA
jgi:secondary thiamine-phosphate synthase enzyme